MFDPYRKWLGIPPRDQPPNHYRLLGLELFESDLDVIEGAVERQMGFIRRHQSGEHAADASRLLNELANARLCLLKPNAKAAYDAKLQAELSSPESAAPELPFVNQSLQIDAAPRRPAAKKQSSRTGRSDGLPRELLIAGGAAGVVVLLVIVFLMSSRPKLPIDSAGQGRTKPKAADSSASDRLPSPRVSPEKPEPAFPAIDKSLLWQPANVATEPAGPPIDLLKLVDLNRDVVSGAWQQTSSGLTGTHQSRIYLPAKTPEDYQLKFVVERHEGADTITFGFMMAGRQGLVSFDANRATVSGLFVDGRDPGSNATTVHEAFFQEQSPATIVLTIHPGHFHASFNGRKVIDWHGDPERMFLHTGVAMGSRETPLITIANAKYTISSATLTPIGPVVETRPARLRNDVELIPLFDMERDADRGVWTIHKDTLTSPESPSRVYLPAVVPEEYTVSSTIELSAEHQSDAWLTVGLPVGNSFCHFVLYSRGVGLNLVNYAHWSHGPTNRPGPFFKPGVPVKVDCTVTKAGVRVELDGRTMVDWRGEPRQLNPNGEGMPADARRLCLDSQTRVKIRDLKLRPPTAPPKSPPVPRLTPGSSVDLLSLIDPARDALNGTWTKQGNVLEIVEVAGIARLAIPYEVPGEYSLKLRVARQGGENGELDVILPIADHFADIVIDAETNPNTSGIHLDWRNIVENETTYAGRVLPLGESVDLEFQVRRTGIKVLARGKAIIDWIGNPDRLTFHPDRTTIGPRITLGSYNHRYRYEKISLEPLAPSAFPTAPAVGADGRLLPVLNVQRDSRRGEWKLDAQGLVSPQIQYSRLRIPVTLPESYVLTMTVEKRAGNDCLFLGLPVAGHPTTVVIDSDTQTRSGVTLLDGLYVDNPGNFTKRDHKSPVLATGKPHKVRCRVTPATIVIDCDDQELLRWHGDPRRLSDFLRQSPPNRATSDLTQISLGSWGTEFLFSDLRLQTMSRDEARALDESFAGPYPTGPSPEFVPQ